MNALEEEAQIMGIRLDTGGTPLKNITGNSYIVKQSCDFLHQMQYTCTLSSLLRMAPDNGIKKW